MRSIHELAARAKVLYPSSTDASVLLYEIRVEEAWREFVHQCGGVYRVSLEMPLPIGAGQVVIPTDLREMIGRIRLAYTPRVIQTIAAVSNVVTVTTTTAHGLSVGMGCAIGDTTAFNNTSAIVVSVVSPTIFTYAATMDNASETAGEVTSIPVYATGLEIATEWPQDIGNIPNGIPFKYWYLNGFKFYVYPPSDGTYPAIQFDYDAEAPESLDLTAALPVPSYIEPGLMGYAAELCGGLPAGAGMQIFAECIMRWKAARSDREQRNLEESSW